MQVKARPRSVLEPVGPRPVLRRPRRWPWVLGALVVAAAGALAAAYVAWPSGHIEMGAAGLPEVHGPGFGGTVVAVSVRDAKGRMVPVAARPDGTLWPREPVVAGTRLSVDVTVRRPGWVGWLVGRTETLHAEVTAPRASLERRWLRVKPGASLRVRFDRPVREVRVTGAGRPRVQRLPKPARVVTLGALGRAGTVGVSAVAQPWERLPPPTSVTWFPPGRAAMALAAPKPGSTLLPDSVLRLRFSGPVAKLLHGRMPSFRPAIPGRWRTVDARTLEFRPRGYGFGLDTRVRLRLPAPVAVGGRRTPTRTVLWDTPTGSELRLEQLLAVLGYLPLTWTPAESYPAGTIRDQLAAAVDPPSGKFSWRYPNTPSPLVELWHEGRYNTIDRGAIMAFQDDHDLEVDAFAGRDVWRAVIADVLAGRHRDGGYSYVFVHSEVPQSLNLWHNGRVILSSPGNTGVPAAPTELGTFPVFEHIPIGTMSGTNPDGSHYNDPGIRYISYFNGGEAIHAFNRASFGTPQSLGCVELPLAAAAKVWPYTPIGTLVTVEH
ncbi:MAG TPA: L,D-transpeptidase [Gaiellaceae bacterium]|nr:L,D-transpeptidase [Gaiellaceae bacterium]